ncbi:unnamed protein product [Arctia plantaginis]|uniref:Uncharacterized protein n=1 Tax=Arctia plantaginis TaxID=874455 RepID=A0A8S0ZA64_ARCPL|nr:unnamed protein product [Arctia plantaginis]CAB3230042.1 unnamed protein product [Arctia plantaginis]
MVKKPKNIKALCKRWRVAGDGGVAAAEHGSEMSALNALNPLVPPLSAAEALSTLLWQPYECRSPPLARSRTDGALVRARGEGDATCAAQSPSGGRHARASFCAIIPRHEMRLPVPAPGPLRKSDSVSVRVPGEPSRQNVSSVNVNIVQVQDVPPGANVNSAVQTERERSVATAECQTEEPARRRRVRRTRAPRVPELENIPPPPYSTLPPAPAMLPHPVPVHPPPPAIMPPPHPPTHRFPFQPIPLRYYHNIIMYGCRLYVRMFRDKF